MERKHALGMPGMEQANQAPPIHRSRRNRKTPSCEPCRKSKVACNHGMPCSRCVRRRRADECYYHPNPLTRVQQNPREALSTHQVRDVATLQSLGNSARSSLNEQLHIAGDDSEVMSILPSQTSRNNRAAQRAGSAPPFYHEPVTQNQGFMGFTSHVSIITEDLMQLGVTSSSLETTTVYNNKPIMNERLVSGCRVLGFLQNRAMIDRGIDLFFGSIDCWDTYCGEFIVRQWLSEMWSCHGKTLSSQNPEQIRQLGELIFNNTATPLVYDGNTTARQWVQAATGNSIRWATIAMIASYVGIYALTAKPSDPFFKDFNVDRQVLVDQVLEVSNLCIGFCRECDAVDDTFLCALLEHFFITEMMKGEASYVAYQTGAEVNSALVAMGLHQEIKANHKVPFFLAELRKRVRAMIYAAEISIATLLGRPPRLSHRYLNLDLPLDLTDEQLFSDDPQEVAAAIARLDDQGYNRDGDVNQISWLRSVLGFFVRREEILELSIGNHDPDEVRQKAADIQRKTEEQWQTLPPYLLRLKDSLHLEDGTEENHLFLRNRFRQIPQSNSLLLHRLLVRKAGASPADLIRTAQGIMSDVMRSYKLLEKPASSSILYFLALHGIRCAVILALELLKQEQLPIYPEAPLLPRSRTIQDLSIFADKLSDMDVLFGDQTLCEKGQKVISLILDKILTPRTSDSNNQSSLLQTRPLDTDILANDMFQAGQNTDVPGSYMTMDNFDYDFGGAISGPDHEFRLWLDSVDSENWVL